MGGNGLHKPADGFDFRETRAVFLSYDRRDRRFVINLTTEKLAYATDYCGVRSGKDVDKFKELHLTPEKAEYVSAPLIAESPVNIECKVVKKNAGGRIIFSLPR